LRYTIVGIIFSCSLSPDYNSLGGRQDILINSTSSVLSMVHSRLLQYKYIIKLWKYSSRGFGDLTCSSDTGQGGSFCGVASDHSVQPLFTFNSIRS
jgi:hypothetical protein